MDSSIKKVLTFIPRIFLTVFLVIQNAGLVLALPEGENVVNGQANFDRNTAGTLNIQAADKSIIQWSGFDIALPETVNFFQPSNSSVVLNRVVGGVPSEIYGALNANGQVFLINPNGILFGAGSAINVSGLVASTLNISNEDFISGKYRFENSGLNGQSFIINKGNITVADSGGVYLIAAAVRNEGVITARLGRVSLLSGDTVILELDNQGRLCASVDEKVSGEVLGPDNQKIKDAAANIGTINAQGGNVEIKTEAVRGIFDNLVNQEGAVRANSLVEHNGVISLVSGSEGIVINTGELDVSAFEAGIDGGSIEIKGEKVGQFGKARADALSGNGGDILIRGEDTAALDSDSLTTANAVLNGGGGEITVFSPNQALFYSGARIEAKAGLLGGNGGFAEVSGKDSMVFQGDVDLKAPNGILGTLLIDPKNITINDAGAGTIADNDTFAENAASDVAFSDDNVESALNGANLTLQANNDITVSFNIDSTGNPGNGNLTLQAGRSIALNNNVALKGSFTATANDTGADVGNRDGGAAALTMADGVTINTSANNDDIILKISVGPNGNDASGDITVEALNAGTGHVLLQNTGTTAGSGVLRASADSLITAASVCFDVNGSGAGETGTQANPMRVTVSNLDARGQSGGVYISSPAQGLEIGGADQGGAVTGVTTSGGGNLELTAADNVTQSEVLTVSGVSSFATTVANKAITLNNAGNALSGAVTLTTSGAAGNVTLDNGTTALDLAASTIGGTLSVTAGEAITQSGALTVGGTSSWTTDVANKAITLNNAGNALSGAVTLTTSGAAGNVTLDNGTTALNLAASTIGGTLSVTAGEAITQSGALTVGGTSSWTTDVAGKAITLNNAGNALSGAVTLTTSGAAGNVTLDNGTTALDLAASTIGGTLSVTAGEAITQSGALTVGGTSSWTTDVANKVITLSNAGNALTGAVAFTTSGASADVSIDNGNTAFDLGASTVGGDLSITTQNNVTDSGALTAVDLTVDTSGAAGATGEITFDTAATDVDRISLTSGNNKDITFTDIDSADIVLLSAGLGTITLNSGGALTQSGAVSAANLLVSSSGSVSFANPANDVDTLAANLTGAGSSFSFYDSDTLTVGTVGVTLGVTANNGDIRLNTGSDLTVDQNVASTGGDIHLVVGGTATFNADVNSSNGDIYIENVSAGQSIDAGFVGGSGDIKIDPSNLSSNIKPGTGILYVGSSNAGDITVGDADFGSKNVGFITAGNIDDRAAGTHLIVANDLTLTASSGSIGNTNPVHTSVSSLTSTSSGATIVHETDDVTLTSITTTNGAVDITADGNMTVTDVNAGGSGRNVALTTQGADNDIIMSGDITALGDTVTLSSTGNITDTTDESTRLRAGVLTITQADSVGSAQANGRLDTEVDYIADSSINSEAYFLEQDDVTLTNIDSIQGRVDLAASGSIYGTHNYVGDEVYGKTGVILNAGQVIGTASAPLWVNSPQGSVEVAAGASLDEVSVNLKTDTGFSYNNQPVDYFVVNNIPPGLVIYNTRMMGGANITNIKDKGFSVVEAGVNKDIVYSYYSTWVSDLNYSSMIQNIVNAQASLISDERVFGEQVLLNIAELGYKAAPSAVQEAQGRLTILDSNNIEVLDLGRPFLPQTFQQPFLFYMFYRFSQMR